MSDEPTPERTFHGLSEATVRARAKEVADHSDYITQVRKWDAADRATLSPSLVDRMDADHWQAGEDWGCDFCDARPGGEWPCDPKRAVEALRKTEHIPRHVWDEWAEWADEPGAARMMVDEIARRLREQR